MEPVPRRASQPDVSVPGPFFPGPEAIHGQETNGLNEEILINKLNQ